MLSSAGAFEYRFKECLLAYLVANAENSTLADGGSGDVIFLIKAVEVNSYYAVQLQLNVVSVKSGFGLTGRIHLEAERGVVEVQCSDGRMV